MGNDPNGELAKKLAELEMNVQRARTETRGLMVALVVTISVLDAIDPTRKVEITTRLQDLAHTHRRNQQDDLANALERLLREV